MEQDFLEQTKGRDIDLFVCTDAEAILGIGDQGVGVSRPVPLRLFHHHALTYSLGHWRTQASAYCDDIAVTAFF
jgi:hypothetical protein